MSGMHTGANLAILSTRSGISLITYRGFSELLTGAAYMHYGATDATQTVALLRELADDIEGHSK